MSLKINELREIYQSSFIDNYETWSKVLKNFNFVCSRMYVAEWQKTVLREDIQFLPYDIEPISYDQYCELFLECLGQFDTQPTGEEMFHKMLELYLSRFYQKFIL